MLQHEHQIAFNPSRLTLKEFTILTMLLLHIPKVASEGLYEFKAVVRVSNPGRVTYWTF